MAIILLKWVMVSLLTFSNASGHPYFVSVVELKNNREAQLLELTCRLFTNDLEGALKNEGFLQTNLTHPTNRKEAEMRLYSYVFRNLSIRVNSKAMNFGFLGYEIKDDAVNVYLQLPFTGRLHNVRFISTLLYREHPEQAGIFHVMEGQKRESRRIVNPDSVVNVWF